MRDLMLKATSREVLEAWLTGRGWLVDGVRHPDVLIEHIGPIGSDDAHHANVRLCGAVLEQEVGNRPLSRPDGAPVHSTEESTTGAAFRAEGVFRRGKANERWVGDVAFIYPESVETPAVVWA